jgi:hypothetical protein
MDGAVDDEHRSGLGSEIRFRPMGKKSSRLEDAGLAVADIENAVRPSWPLERALARPNYKNSDTDENSHSDYIAGE